MVEFRAVCDGRLEGRFSPLGFSCCPAAKDVTHLQKLPASCLVISRRASSSLFAESRRVVGDEIGEGG